MTTLAISTTLDYALAGPTDIILSVEAAPTRGQRLIGARIDLPPAQHFARVPAEDGIGERILLKLEARLLCEYESEVEIDRPIPDLASLPATPVHLLPGEAVAYLMASRFCPSDRFQSFVASEFGGLTGGAAVAAMSDWCSQKLTYVSGASGPHTTALETFVQRQGVCRDYAHLMITLARAAAIPARISSVYATDVAPQDFHAVAEVWLDGAWHLVDATGMASPDAMARICVGRDAADVAFLTTYGAATLQRQQVSVSRA